MIRAIEIPSLTVDGLPVDGLAADGRTYRASVGAYTLSARTLAGSDCWRWAVVKFGGVVAAGEGPYPRLPDALADALAAMRKDYAR